MRILLPILFAFLFSILSSQAVGQLSFSDYPTIPRADLRIRDPYIVPVQADGYYYMYASISVDVADERGTTRGVGVYRSKNLETWQGPLPVFHFPEDFWANNQIWAPEVHPYQGKYYLFATFSSHDPLPTPPKRKPNIKRQTQILIADGPTGPFKPFRRDRGHTPEMWMALDGTLWEEDGVPYMIYCHEWFQIVDGSMELVELKPDLSDTVDAPETLFYASDASWSRSLLRVGVGTQHGWVTDGCFLFRTKNDRLLMIWSSFGEEKYAIGQAYSESGSVKGPWVQMEDPLFPANGGHGMIFESFGGQLMLTFHQPNTRSEERSQLYQLIDGGDRLILGDQIPFGTPVEE